jgi:predicted dehydrogenase
MEPNIKSPLTGQDTRRDFIKKTATAAAAVAATGLIKTPVYGQSQAPSANVAGANNKLVVGFIGLGGQGTAHLHSQINDAAENNIEIAGVADVWKNRKEKAKQTAGGKCQGYDDFRKMLEQKDIDAVTIATVDHWHTPCSIAALEAGKHVYVEKPMTRYLDEAFRLHDTVKKTGKTLQVGSQGCSDAQWHKGAELITAGKIGPLVLGQDSYMRNSPKGEWNYAIDPDATAETIDWKFWRGQVLHPDTVNFNADHYFRWRKYSPYCAGLLGDLIPHRLHPLMLATGHPEFPARVVSIGNAAFHTDMKTPGTYMRTVPENQQLLAEFPSGLCLALTTSSVNEQGLLKMMRGQQATLYFSVAGNRVELKPERNFADEIDPETFDGLNPAGEQLGPHEKNFFDCIRTNKQPNCGIDLAIRVQTVISLAEMSQRLGVACLFDEKTRKVTSGPDGREVQPFTYEIEAEKGPRIEKVA